MVRTPLRVSFNGSAMSAAMRSWRQLQGDGLGVVQPLLASGEVVGVGVELGVCGHFRRYHGSKVFWLHPRTRGRRPTLAADGLFSLAALVQQPTTGPTVERQSEPKQPGTAVPANPGRDKLGLEPAQYIAIHNLRLRGADNAPVAERNRIAGLPAGGCAGWAFPVNSALRGADAIVLTASGEWAGLPPPARSGHRVLDGRRNEDRVISACAERTSCTSCRRTGYLRVRGADALRAGPGIVNAG
jgi:hypothetical protein